jgi:hypothetical protein
MWAFSLTNPAYQSSTIIMKFTAVPKPKIQTFFVLVSVVIVTSIVSLGMNWLYATRLALEIPVAAQTDMMVERRISQVEHRFNYLESRLNQLENHSRYPSVLPGGSTSGTLQASQMRTELDTLRSQLDSVRARVGEVECGLLKVDERTLSQAERDARRRAAATNDPCRNQPTKPVSLSVRP